MKKMNAKRNGGFTLIELLVVIAIIGILSSIVLVSLNRRETRVQTQKLFLMYRKCALGSSLNIRFRISDKWCKCQIL